MEKIIVKFSLLVLASTLWSCGNNPKEQNPKNKEKDNDQALNIILMIGDGMGVPQVSTAFYFGKEEPNFKAFNTIGLSQTSSVSHLITDSASGATAFSTGEKTYKRAIGVSKDSLPLPTILEQLKEKKYQTGLVSLTSVTHATPAAFYAHVKDRDMHPEIADQLVDADINYIAGGGLKYFSKTPEGRARYKRMVEKNYHFDTISLNKPDEAVNNIFLLAEDGLPSKTEGRKDFLQQATKNALDYFDSREEPFFFMVEGSYIDWGGHAEDSQMMIQEVIDFDKTIGIVLEYIETHPNTLLVVTADHETGGVSIGKYYDQNDNEVPLKVQVNFNGDQHSTELVPVFAKGKKEHLFQGIYNNNEIYHKLLKAVNNEADEV